MLFSITGLMLSSFTYVQPTKIETVKNGLQAIKTELGETITSPNFWYAYFFGLTGASLGRYIDSRNAKFREKYDQFQTDNDNYYERTIARACLGTSMLVSSEWKVAVGTFCGAWTPGLDQIKRIGAGVIIATVMSFANAGSHRHRY